MSDHNITAILFAAEQEFRDLFQKLRICSEDALKDNPDIPDYNDKKALYDLGLTFQSVNKLATLLFLQDVYKETKNVSIDPNYLIAQAQAGIDAAYMRLMTVDEKESLN